VPAVQFSRSSIPVGPDEAPIFLTLPYIFGSYTQLRRCSDGPLLNTVHSGKLKFDVSGNDSTAVLIYLTK
jgi:hypothetical protein